MPALKNVVNKLVSYSNAHEIACWDLYGIMGGEYSINKWSQNKIVQPDRIHFNAKGYEMLAGWLFKAFVSAMQNNPLTINYSSPSENQYTYVIH